MQAMSKGPTTVQELFAALVNGSPLKPQEQRELTMRAFDHVILHGGQLTLPFRKVELTASALTQRIKFSRALTALNEDRLKEVRERARLEMRKITQNESEWARIGIDTHDFGLDIGLTPGERTARLSTLSELLTAPKPMADDQPVGAQQWRSVPISSPRPPKAPVIERRTDLPGFMP